MSSTRTVREDDENKSGRSGLGLAAAAAAVGVGLGIGAALYYFFKPDEEAPQTSTSRDTYSARNLFNETFEQPRPADSLTVEQQELTKINAELYCQRSWSLESCSICLEEMSAGDRELWMLPCGHKFHIKCARPWTEQNNNCPNCRKAI